VFAVPAGMVIWLVSNIFIDGISIANHFINWINPFAFLFGLNGVIFLAYIIAIPANEIIIPTILMLTVANLGLMGIGAGSGVMFELDSVADTSAILYSGGWTLLTGINLMLFSLLHNPCSTTIYTIYKETKSVKWTMVSTILPVVMGLIVTFFVTQVWRLLAK
jgi:ferrous iron transport protein B